MNEVIRLFNEEELDASQLNMLRRRVQIDFIVQEDTTLPQTGQYSKRGEELDVKRFLKIYKGVIRD